jgi:hypothetical protein
MSNQEFPESLNKRIEFYYQILKESWLDTTLYNDKQKERERMRRYHNEIDRFLV